MARFEEWVFWYEHNRDALEPLREARLGGAGNAAGGESRATEAYAALAKQAVPVLLRILESGPRGDAALVAEAHLALARITRDGAHIELLLRPISSTAQGPELDAVRTAATVALGLLRRPVGSELPGEALDEARARLWDLLEGRAAAWSGSKCFAAVSLALLADQPSVTSQGASLVRSEFVRRLWASFPRLPAKGERFEGLGEELACALCLALGQLPPAAISDAIRADLCRVSSETDRALSMVRSCALQCLGRVGDAACMSVLLEALRAPARNRNVSRSAAVALGQLGLRIAGGDRVDLARSLARAIDAMDDETTGAFALISLSRLVARDVAEGKLSVLHKAGVGRLLLPAHRKGTPTQLAYRALALGIIARSIAPEQTEAAYREFERSAVAWLRDGLQDGTLTGRTRASFALGLGLAEDVASRDALLSLVLQQKDDDLCGYAAVALGLIRAPTRRQVEVLRAVLAGGGSRMLRHQVTTALGLLHDGDEQVRRLLTALTDPDRRLFRAQHLLELARLGDGSAVPTLVALVDDPKETLETRSLACAVLGCIGDLDRPPAWANLLHDLNYRCVPHWFGAFQWML